MSSTARPTLPPRSFFADLRQDRLLTVDEGTVEVAHEALLREWPRLRTWLAEDAQGRELRTNITDAARSWETADEEESGLYRGARLTAALDWADAHDRQLNELERRFLETGRQASELEAVRHRRTNRRLRGLLVGVALFLVVALVAASVAYVQRGRAEHASTVADARRLATESLAEDHFDRSILLALAAVRLDDSSESRSALFASLLRSPAIGVMNANQPLSGVSLSPDGKTLAVVGDNGDLELFGTASRTQTDEPIRRVGGATAGFAPQVAYGPTGRLIAVTENTYFVGGYVDVIDTSTGRIAVHEGLGPNTSTDSIAFSPDERMIAAVVSTNASNGGPLRKAIVVFDAQTGCQLDRLPLVGIEHALPNGALTQVAFLPDGRLVSSTYGAISVIWSLRSGKAVRRFHVGGALALSPDGRTAAVGQDDGSVVLLNLSTGRSRPMDGRHAQLVEALTFTRDGETLLSGGDDGNVMVWDVDSGGLRETWSGHGQISGVVVSPDGATAYSTNEDGTVMIWDLKGERRLGRRFDVGDAYGGIPTFALSANAKVLAVSRDDGSVDLWDLHSLTRLEKIRDSHGPFYGLALSPDGRKLVTNGGDGTVTLWDVAARSKIGRPQRATKGIGFAAEFSPDGRMFATGGDTLPSDKHKTGTFILWDANAGERLHTFKLRGSPWGPSPWGVAFSPDGRYLLGFTGEPGDEAATWDVSSGRRTLLMKDNLAVQAAFAADPRSAAFGSGDGSVTFRDIETGNQTAPPLRGLAGDNIAVGPDGTELAVSGNGTGIVQLWDLTTRQQIGSNLPGPINVKATAAFTPDGHHLLAVYNDGTAIMWDIDAASWESTACAVAGRSLSQAEWSELLPDRPYQQLCP